MFLILTRNFPPEIGGMQNLMYGLTKSLSKLNIVKVFADYHKNYLSFDNNVNFSIERIGGIKSWAKRFQFEISTATTFTTTQKLF